MRQAANREIGNLKMEVRIRKMEIRTMRAIFEVKKQQPRRFSENLEGRFVFVLQGYLLTLKRQTTSVISNPRHRYSRGEISLKFLRFQIKRFLPPVEMTIRIYLQNKIFIYKRVHSKKIKLCYSELPRRQK